TATPVDAVVATTVGRLCRSAPEADAGRPVPACGALRVRDACSRLSGGRRRRPAPCHRRRARIRRRRTCCVAAVRDLPALPGRAAGLAADCQQHPAPTTEIQTMRWPARLFWMLLVAAGGVVATMPPDRVARFRADLDTLASELPKRHANLFHTTPKADFE